MTSARKIGARENKDRRFESKSDNRSDKMRKYISIFNSSHEKLIEFINIYYARRGWRIISIVKGNGDFWATLELETEKNND